MATQDIQLRNSEDARDNEILATLTKHIQQKLVGNEKAIQLLLVALIAGGHVLLEDDPGSGKTALSRAFSESLALQFKRVQCTPDLLPSDLTGLDIYQPDTKTFKFIEGPLFTQILLTDELNRATPRTQSALLESMAEKQVTVDGNTHQLSEFFFVIATQNPLETAGTFTLPEAQLDRFLFQFSLSQLTVEQKDQMLQQALTGSTQPALAPIFKQDQLKKMREQMATVTIHAELRQYLIALCRGVINIPGVIAGISNRGLLDFAHASQALAYLKGRRYVTPEDIQALAIPLLAHRLFYRQPMITTQQKEAAIQTLLTQVKVPTENWKEG